MSGLRSQPLSEPDWRRFREVVKAKTGIVLPDSRRSDLADAVAAVREECGYRDTDALYARVSGIVPDSRAIDGLISRVTVNETHFWRNAPQFQALLKHVGPELVKEGRARRRLKIWSAACSTGEEPYSLAMLLHRLLPDIAAWDVSIVATDIDPQCLVKARGARYGKWSFRETPKDVVRDYFTTAPDGRLEVVPEIRKLVRFQRHNLLDPMYTGHQDYDLILCRNVLIYFDEPTVKAIAGKLHAALRPGGWLVVGHAEPSHETFHQFTTRTFPGTVLYQKPEPAPGLRTGPTRHALRSAPAERPPLPRKVVTPMSRELLVRARRHADRRELAQADALVREALAADAVDPNAHYLQGIIRQEQGRLEEALVSLRRATFLDPNHTLAGFALASVLARLGQGGRAEKQLTAVESQLTGRKPNDPVSPGEQMTVGRLLDLVVTQRQITRST